VSVVALDFGERRIGVAVSDPLGMLARPLAVIERGSLAEDLARIEAMVKQRRADKIVLGLPLNMDGTVGPQAKRARRFGARLKRALGLEIILWDERLTTVEAEEALAAAGRGHPSIRRGGLRAGRTQPEAGRERRDAVAAAVILQDYLDAQRRSAEQ
jgi:putative Holliday junction resolvase